MVVILLTGCFKCGEEGHMSRECPTGGGGGGGGGGKRGLYTCHVFFKVKGEASCSILKEICTSLVHFPVLSRIIDCILGPVHEVQQL